jgi:hypothetical protein
MTRRERYALRALTYATAAAAVLGLVRWMGEWG